jgi:nitrate/nitrite transport system permease protein
VLSEGCLTHLLGAVIKMVQTNKAITHVKAKSALIVKIECIDWKTIGAELVKKSLALMLSIAMLLSIWTLVASQTDGFPGPVVTWEEAKILFAHPFYKNGPNDMGIGWNIYYSLKRVAVGFGLAALVGIPMGFLVGRFAIVNHVANPIISMLRPVSPLAWLPIGLFVFKAADPSAIWVIFICSIWPMVLNTAEGVRNVPKDYLNVAKVLNLSEWKIATKILLPATMPHIITGVKLAVGTAWLVIVAAEMLTGCIGI